MKTRFAPSLCSLTGAFFLVACASTQVEKKVDQELARAPAAATGLDVRQQVDRAIAEARGLSELQRTRLKALRAASGSQLEDLRGQWLKLEALLARQAVSSDYEPRQIVAIESRMRKIDDKRLDLLFEAVAQANLILGRGASQHERLIHGLMQENRFIPLML